VVSTAAHTHVFATCLALIHRKHVYRENLAGTWPAARGRDRVGLRERALRECGGSGPVHPEAIPARLGRYPERVNRDGERMSRRPGH
jgi:hypothetical protein